MPENWKHRVLMIAPQPFFESRGAPFCVYQHIKALTTLGYAVDLVTYPIGKSVRLPGLRIFRAPAIPFVRSVKPGPSLAKIPLDITLFLTALLRLLRRKYAFIHTHEEGGLMGAALSRLFGCQHLYYMHSDLSQVVVSSGFTHNAWLLRCVEAVQRFMIRKADAVIAFYPEIVKSAQALAPGKDIYQILPPALDEDLPAATRSDVERLRRELRLGDGPVLLYTGTLESYQGIDLLIRSIPEVVAAHPAARFVIAGGKTDQVRKLQQLAGEWDVADSIRFVGQRPLEQMPAFMALADVLLSPRSKGTHTPLKLYTYLRSGKPILATDILAHTQILTPEIALLVPPTPQELARGAIELLDDKQQAALVGARARQVAEERYNWAAFLERNRQVYTQVMGPASTHIGQPAGASTRAH
jgi:glycosyltransferase involved in cell wall biosynthesis